MSITVWNNVFMEQTVYIRKQNAILRSWRLVDVNFQINLKKYERSIKINKNGTGNDKLGCCIIGFFA